MSQATNSTPEQNLQTLALFDLDHTILDMDSDYGWGDFLVGHKLVDREWFAGRNDYFYQQYEAGKLDPVEYIAFVGQMFNMLGDDLQTQLSTYVDEVVAPKIRPQAIDALLAHAKAGDQIVVTSATNTVLVSAIVDKVVELASKQTGGAAKLKTPDVLGTVLEHDGQKFRGQIAGTPNFQAGKLVNLKRLIADSDHRFAKSVAYSDSFNDLPLLEFADTAYAVTPDARLRAEAESRGWAILDWSMSA